jgi:hypothetical protein
MYVDPQQVPTTLMRPAMDAGQPPVSSEVLESRRGTHVFPEVGLPEGFEPPSAALAPPADYDDS